MSCKKGGFVVQRHNEIRDVTVELMAEMCKDDEVEPQLIKFNGEEMVHKSAKTNDHVRIDIAARCFWVKGQRL